MGAQLVREVASKTSDTAGDGTTTATVLAQAIYRKASKNPHRRRQSMEMKRGINKAVECRDRQAEEAQQAPQENKTEISQVGTISANNDATIERPHRGSDGEGRQGWRHHGGRSQVDVDPLDVVEGIQFDRGYISPVS